MVVEVFASVRTDLAIGCIKDGLQKAFRALVEAEIHQIDLNNSVREPFRVALSHLPLSIFSFKCLAQDSELLFLPCAELSLL